MTIKKQNVTLICKKSFNPISLEKVKKRLKNRKRCLKLGYILFDDFVIPDMFHKDELVEFIMYDGYGKHIIAIPNYDIILKDNELNEYFENELITSRILKLRKLQELN